MAAAALAVVVLAPLLAVTAVLPEHGAPTPQSSFSSRAQVMSTVLPKQSPTAQKTPEPQRKLKEQHRLPMPFAKAASFPAAVPRHLSDSRRFRGDVCGEHAECQPNDYCMDCTLCMAYHRSMNPNQQMYWTCDPCRSDTSAHCESGRYCEVANDGVGGECPDFRGCAVHSDCSLNEYCFDCTKCMEESHADEIWQCQPCPTTLGGFCGPSPACAIRGDSIDGQCPQPHGCSSHDDCWVSHYCEGCEACQAYHEALPESQQPYWNCGSCPTSGGGFCEDLIFCQVASDGIDGTCPQHKGCNAHAQCQPNEYCMDCQRCAAVRDALPPAEQASWTCDPCPTGRGGSCQASRFCPVHNDSISGVCPELHGCSSHQDCVRDEFCLKHDACLRELSVAACGASPNLGGLCFDPSLCTPDRSITGDCPIPPPCSSHLQCASGSFCTLWSDCMRQEPHVCGPPPMRGDGVCLPAVHCLRGLHAPIGGECPPAGHDEGSLVVSVGLHLEGSLQLAVHHQAINSWGLSTAPEGELLRSELGMFPGGSVHISTTRGQVFLRAASGSATGASQALVVRYHLTQLPLVAGSTGTIHVHGGVSCASEAVMGDHYWSSADGLTTDPWVTSSRWVADGYSNASGAFEITTGYGVEQNRGRIVVVRDESGNGLACGILAEEHLVVQLHDYGDVGLEADHDDLEYVGIYGTASTMLVQEQQVALSCPLVEVAIPGKAGYIFEGRIHRTEFEMSTKHAECSCVRGEDGGVCPRGAMLNIDQGPGTVVMTSFISRMHPVLFLGPSGAGFSAMRNNLTLYTLKLLFTGEAQLVDSSLGNGEGEPTLGCPMLEDPAVRTEVPTVEGLQAEGKVLPASHMSGKWCVARVGPEGEVGCTATSKYKFCIASGAIGVILLQDQATSERGEDTHANIYLSLEEAASMGQDVSILKPAFYFPFDQELFNALSSTARTVRIDVGPDVGGEPSQNFEVSDGGVRVYDVEHRAWAHHTGNFGSLEWMQHSYVRDVLFVCTSNHEIMALDSSTAFTSMPTLGQAPSYIACHRSPTFRDYHVGDIKQGSRYFTVVVDPSATTNRLHFFETTDLSNWQAVAEVHADWEYDVDGLGQVIPVPGGQRLLVTWHCSTLYCGMSSDGRRRGERIYVLELQGLAMGQTPQVIDVVELPMTEGSMVRDIACDLGGICVASLTWDGLVAIDLNDGPNRHKIVGRHSASFNVAHIPAHIAFARMAVGAQRVIPSRSRERRFYIEHWALDVDKFLQGGVPLGDCLRFDTVWVVDLESYIRPTAPPDTHYYPDPPVHARLMLGATMDSLLAAVPGANVALVERMVAMALQEALGVQGHRVIILRTAAAHHSDGARAGVLIDFEILPGEGQPPEMLFRMLQRQLETTNSAIHRGSLAPFVEGALLTREQYPYELEDQDEKRDEESSHTFEVIVLLVLAVAVSVTAWAVALAWRARRTASLAAQRAVVVARQNPPQEVATMMAAYAESPAYVIGRPNAGGDVGGGDPASAAAAASGGAGAGGVPGSAYVVGTPVDPNRAAGAGAAVSGGTALSEIDTNKLAQESSSGAAASAAAGAAGPAEAPAAAAAPGAAPGAAPAAAPAAAAAPTAAPPTTMGAGEAQVGNVPVFSMGSSSSSEEEAQVTTASEAV